MKFIPVGFNIYQSEISDDFYNFLVKEFDNTESYKQLHQNENFWGGSDYTFVKDDNKEYIENCLLDHVDNYLRTRSMRLKSQWINIQAHDGFFPLHNHSGNISYVIYIKVPEYISNYKNKLNNDIGYSEGCLHFVYGHQTSISSPNTIVRPMEKMILMFPSELQHYVYPFKDKDAQRVSVSGNLEFTN